MDTINNEIGPGYTVTIVEAKDGVQVTLGRVSAPLFAPAIVGRGDTTDFQIDDNSVSRKHVRITPLENAFLFESLSKNGTTFLNGEPLEYTEHRLIEDEDAWVQIGRVLVKVVPMTETVPINTAMPIPESNDGNYATITVRDGPNPEVWLAANPVALFPQAAKMLRALAREPTKVLTYDEIGREVDPEGYLAAGGANYAQLATYIRNVIVDSIDAGELDPTAFALTLDDTTDSKTIARKLVKNVRSIGYTLDTRSAQVIPRTAPAPRKKR